MTGSLATRRLLMAGFRYHPAIGGAELLARRLIAEIGDRMLVDVVTVATENRSDWLALLVDGMRDEAMHYQVDSRDVVALARWDPDLRRRLKRLRAFYHLPGSPIPSIMGRQLSPALSPVVAPADVVHNVFMGREAFSIGLLLAAHEAKKPFVFTPLRHERPLGWSSPAFRQLYRESDAIIALTRSEAQWLIDHGARPETVRVIGAGPLNDPEASPDPAQALLGDGPFVLFLGQLHRYKGVHVLLDVAGRLRQVKFVFAGPDVRGHARLFAGTGANVTYLASIDDRLRDSLLRACTVLCVPSARESFGLVLVEAWNCGRPVIGGPAAATRELIDDGVDGWSCPQDPAIIAARIGQLLDDPGLALSLGAAGKQKVRERFSWPAIANAHLEVYSRLLQ